VVEHVALGGAAGWGGGCDGELVEDAEGAIAVGGREEEGEGEFMRL
jgi:hypothetical protein